MLRRRLILGLLFLGSLLGLAMNPVLAISQDQLNTFSSGIYYFDTDVNGTCTLTLSSVNLLGSDNVEKAFNYLVQKGLPAMAAAGAVGNMMEESGVDPQKLQGGSEVATPPISDKVGWGIVQWTGAGVQQNLVKSAKEQNVAVNDLGFQLNFLWQQLNSNPDYYKLPDLKAATSPSQAADIFEAGFERADPAKANLPVREQGAQQVYQQYGGGNSVVITASNGASGVATNCGQASQFSGAFPFYSQCDSKWGSKPYAGDTICAAGCGPTSMAMIITALTGTSVTPDNLATFYTQNGFSGSFGTAWGAAPVAAKKWELQAQAIGSDVAKISAAVQAGALVIMAGQGGLPFTSAGHFVVVRAVAPDGKWLLADPDTAAGHSNTSEWDPAQVMAGVNTNGGASSVYAITK